MKAAFDFRCSLTLSSDLKKYVEHGWFELDQVHYSKDESVPEPNPDEAVVF